VLRGVGLLPTGYADGARGVNEDAEDNSRPAALQPPTTARFRSFNHRVSPPDSPRAAQAHDFRANADRAGAHDETAESWHHRAIATVRTLDR